MTDMFPEGSLLTDEPMRNHTTFRVGGPADIVFLPDCAGDVIKMITLCRNRNIPYVVIGNGSNVLFMDEGFRGTVIKIGRRMDNIRRLAENTLEASSGVLLSKIANFCLENSLSGFEFAAGIPGTLGGALYMNAGAYGGEIKDCVKSVEVITEELEIKTVDNSECAFAYRESGLQKEKWIAVKALLSFKKGAPEEIKALMNDYSAKRSEKQPLNLASAGSAFKRPKNNFAGRLIEDSGLKGFGIGGAQVSEKHAGFIINKGNATAKDICDLILHIQKTVKEKFGVYLETEVQMICNS